MVKKIIASKIAVTFILLLLIFIPVRLYNINEPLRNITSFRQAQTATVAFNFYNNGINFFKSELDIFGTGKEKYLTLEFPLYQVFVAVLYKIFFVSDIWGRILSLLSGFSGAYYLFLIVLLILKNTKLAILSSFFFLSAPLNMFHQRDFLIEPFIIACLLSGFYYFLLWLESNKNRHWLLSVILFSLGFIQKIMYGPFMFIPLVWYYFRKKNIKAAFSNQFILILLIPLTVYLLWQKQADLINISNNQYYFASGNFKLLEWNIGTLSDRISIPLWQFRLKNILNGMFLKPGLAFFLIGVISFFHRPVWRFFYIWLLGELIYFLLFFRIQSHIYYQMIIIPVTSIFMAGGLLKIKKYCGYFPITLIAAFYFWRSLISSQWDVSLDLAWYSRLMSVGRVVSGEKYGILVNPGYDWNSVYSYYPRLKLLTLSVENFNEQNLETWQNQGYSYAILHRYKEFQDYLNERNLPITINFIDAYKKVLELEDFKVYLLHD